MKKKKKIFLFLVHILRFYEQSKYLIFGDIFNRSAPNVHSVLDLLIGVVQVNPHGQVFRARFAVDSYWEMKDILFR